MSKFLNIRVDQTVESRWQPREGVGDPDAFDELVANVKVHGITNPLKAFINSDGAYELITGHRRRRAAIRAGLTHIPLIVVATPKDEAGLRALHAEVLFDNLLHEPLTPLEEARAFKALQEEEGYSIRQMAEQLGKSKSYVGEKLKLLDMPKGVQEMVSARADTARSAREIAKVEDPEQQAKLIEQAKAGATTREIEAEVTKAISPKPQVRQAPTRKGPALPDPPEEEPHSETIEEPVGERRIPVNGNGKTTYVTAPAQAEEPTPEPERDQEIRMRIQQVTRKLRPSGVCSAAAMHCPHCGDGQGRETCNSCGRSRWIIAFGSFEDYQRAIEELVKAGVLVHRLAA